MALTITEVAPEMQVALAARLRVLYAHAGNMQVVHLRFPAAPADGRHFPDVMRSTCAAACGPSATRLQNVSVNLLNPET
jgi:hypothetical protein